MRLLKELEMRLAIADAAEAFYTAACYDNEAAKLRLEELGKRIQELDTFLYPPPMECVMEDT